MTKARFNLSDIDLAHADDGGLLPELWSEIFKYLEPGFLYSVLTTSKLFNAAASSNSCFNSILTFYFQEQVLPSPEGESYYLFKKIYLKEAAPLSFPARKLFDLCHYRDFAQIENENYKFNPNVLFEKDAYNTSLLSHINNYQNQFLRDLIFQKVHAWHLKNITRNTFLRFFHSNYHDERNKLLIALKFAAALNQLYFIEQNNEHFRHNIEFRTGSNDNLIHFACRYGHIDMIAKLLECGEHLDVISEEEQQSPLEYAVIGNQTTLITYLFDNHLAGIFPFIEKAAHLAINDDRLEALELVLNQLKDSDSDNDSDSDSDNDYEHADLLKNLLTLACQNKQQEAAAVIIKMFPTLIDNEVDNFIFEAAYAGCASLIKLFLNKTNDIPQYLQSHPNVLAWSASSGNPELVNYLLDMDAPINARGSDNKTALHMAAQEGRFEVVCALVERDADLTLMTPKRNTALDIATENKNKDIEQYLKDAQREKRKRFDSMEELDPEIKEPDQKRMRR